MGDTYPSQAPAVKEDIVSTPQEWLEGSCQCTKCHGDMRPQLGTLHYTLDDMTITVEDVPMTVCESCGMRIIPGIPAMAIDELVHDVVNAERARSITDRVTIHYREQRESSGLAYA